MKRLITLAWLGLGLLSCASKQESAAPSAPPDSEGFVTADDGIRLFYRRVGDGARAVVIPADLFLHPAMRGLGDEHTLVFYDMRNRGRSDSVPASRENSIQRDVADLENLRAQLGLERVSLVGWSYLGLMVALYALEHPERVERIVQIGPVPIRFDTEYPAGLGPADRMAAMDSSALADVRRLRAQGLHESDPQQYCEREWAVTRFTLVGNPAHVDRLPASPCASPNEWPAHFARHLERHFTSVQHLSLPKDSVSRLSKPVLVIHGTLDRNAPYGAGREWAMTLPKALLLTVEGAAHCPWADEPDLVLGAMRTFLRGAWPAGVEKVERLERPAQVGS